MSIDAKTLFADKSAARKAAALRKAMPVDAAADLLTKETNLASKTDALELISRLKTENFPPPWIRNLELLKEESAIAGDWDYKDRIDREDYFGPPVVNVDWLLSDINKNARGDAVARLLQLRHEKMTLQKVAEWLAGVYREEFQTILGWLEELFASVKPVLKRPGSTTEFSTEKLAAGDADVLNDYGLYLAPLRRALMAEGLPDPCPEFCFDSIMNWDEVAQALHDKGKKPPQFFAFRRDDGTTPAFEVDGVPWKLMPSWTLEIACAVIAVGHNMKSGEVAGFLQERTPGWNSEWRAIKRCAELAQSFIDAGLLKNPDTPNNWIIWAKSQGYSVEHLRGIEGFPDDENETILMQVSGLSPPAPSSAEHFPAGQLTQGKTQTEEQIPSVRREPGPNFSKRDDFKWENVIITWLTDDKVQVSYGKTPLKHEVTYGQMGFKNYHETKIDKPIESWTLFRTAFTWQDFDLTPNNKRIGDKYRDTIKHHVSDIRKKLKSFFHTDEDPFKPYSKIAAWEPKFVIRDERDKD